MSRDIPGIGFAAYTSDWPNHTYEMEQDNLKPVGHNGFTVQAQAMAALLHDFATTSYRAAVEKEFAGIKALFQEYLQALEKRTRCRKSRTPSSRRECEGGKAPGHRRRHRHCRDCWSARAEFCRRRSGA